MKIYSIEVQTDLGRRVVQLAPPINIDPTVDMPQQFRSLTEALWGVVCEMAVNGLVPATPKAEA
jgi:hypothetical protein